MDTLQSLTVGNPENWGKLVKSWATGRNTSIQASPRRTRRARFAISSSNSSASDATPNSHPGSRVSPSCR